MKLWYKIGSAAIGVSLLLPVALFAEESEAYVNTYVKVEANSNGETVVNTDVRATTTKPKDNIRERLDEIKARANEQRQTIKSEAEAKRETLKGEIEGKKEEIKNKLENKREEVKDKARNNIKERLSKFMGQLTERFNAAIDRLEKIADRLSSRIAKLEAEGVNVTEAKLLLETAKLKISIAASSTAAINIQPLEFMDQNASSTATTTSIKDGYQNIKNMVEKAKSDIKAAHKALIDVVNSIKAGRNKDRSGDDDRNNDNNSTSTATTTSN